MKSKGLENLKAYYELQKVNLETRIKIINLFENVILMYGNVEVYVEFINFDHQIFILKSVNGEHINGELDIVELTNDEFDELIMNKEVQ